MGLIKRILVGSPPEPPREPSPNPAHDPNLLARLDNLEASMRALKLEWEDIYDKIGVRLGRLSRIKQQIERQDRAEATNDEQRDLGITSQPTSPGDQLRAARARYGRRIV
jgi:hypothetical protein